MIQQGERRCEVVRGAVDTTEEESIDRELRRASDGLYLNKAAVIGIGALPVIGAAAVAVKRPGSQDVHDVTTLLREQADKASKEATAWALAYMRCVATQEGTLSSQEQQLSQMLAEKEEELKNLREANDTAAVTEQLTQQLRDKASKEATAWALAYMRCVSRQVEANKGLEQMKIVLEHSESVRGFEHEEKNDRMTMLNAAQCSVTELFKGARNELKEAEAKSTAQLTALTQQRHRMIQMLEEGNISYRTAGQRMDTWIWKNKDIFTSHDWLYYSDAINLVIQPECTNYSVLLSILDPLLRARQQDAGQAAGDIRVSISMSKFETCLRDWSQTEPSPQHIQQIRSTPQINHTFDESPTESYRERIEKEWVEMVTRVFPGNVANFVPTHGGKAHHRTPSWWEGPQPS